MIVEWINTVLGTVVGLLPIANPFSTAVVFLAIAGRLPKQRQRQQAGMAAVYMASVLLVSLIAGSLIM